MNSAPEIQDLFEMYEAYFNCHPSGHRYWESLFRECNVMYMKKAFKRLANEPMRRYKPKFTEAVAAYKVCSPKSAVKREIPECETCGSGGIIYTVLGRRDDQWYVAEHPEFDEYRIQKHPCQCHWGVFKNDVLVKDSDPVSQLRKVQAGWQRWFRNEQQARMWIEKIG